MQYIVLHADKHTAHRLGPASVYFKDLDLVQEFDLFDLPIYFTCNLLVGPELLCCL